MARPDRTRPAAAPRDGGFRRSVASWLVGTLVVLGGLVATARLIPGLPRGGANSLEPSGRGRPSTAASPQARGAGHETEEMSGGLMGRLVFVLGTVALAVVLLMAGLNAWLHRYHGETQPAVTALQTAPVTPPLPHLQTDPVGELARLHQQEDALLGNYAFRDPAHTRARIPIGRAMVLMVGHGLDGAP